MSASTVQTPRRTRWLAVAVLASTFVAGALAGAGLVRLHLACRADEEGFEGRRLPPPLAALDLTGDQLRQVQEIRDRYHPRVQQAMQASWPALKPVFDEMAGEIKVFLTEDQRTRFDRLRKEMEAQRFGNGAPPPQDAPGSGPSHEADRPDGRVP